MIFLIIHYCVHRFLDNAETYTKSSWFSLFLYKKSSKTYSDFPAQVTMADHILFKEMLCGSGQNWIVKVVYG